MRLNSHPSRPSLPANPRADQRAGPRSSRDGSSDDRSPRGPEFNALAKKVLRSVRQVFQTKQPVIVYPASGTGAWEAALVNTLSPGDLVLMWETGHFASSVEEDGRQAWNPIGIHGRRLAQAGRSRGHREAPEGGHRPRHQGGLHRPQRDVDGRGERHLGGPAAPSMPPSHPALLLVDTISSLGSVDYRHDAWGVDVTVAGSQKGLMLPPGLSFNALSEKALAASKASKMVKAFWGWDEMLAANANGWFPYTPATNLLYGLSEACDMLLEEGLDAVFARHARHAEATRDGRDRMGAGDPVQRPQAPIRAR
jgi:alanine-glyoxylate transaminase/serine-glyoxylate transaminase/serine-pyruvate transaminase